MFDMKLLIDRARADLEDYARSRERDVARGAETPELGALLVQKYGYGLNQALRIAADIADEPPPSLIHDVDRLVGEIDPAWREHQERRYAALPASLVLNHPGPA